MKQDIAIDFEEVEKLYKCNEPSNDFYLETLPKIFAFQKLIKDYHCILTDQYHTDNGAEISLWYSKCRKLSLELECTKGNTSDSMRLFLKDYFDNQFVRNRDNFVSCRIESQSSNIFEELALHTPDKILVKKLPTQSSGRIKGVKYYSMDDFITEGEYKPHCVLLRNPKIINLKPGYILKSVNFIAPYIRDAEKIEFCDPFLSQNDKFYNSLNNDYQTAKFIIEIVKQCPNLNILKLIYKYDEEDDYLDKLIQEMGTTVNSLSIEKIPYKKHIHENHDRFIIVNDNEYSITFTSSFNNLLCNGISQFKVNKAMKIIFNKGRDYIG